MAAAVSVSPPNNVTFRALAIYSIVLSRRVIKICSFIRKKYGLYSGRSRSLSPNSFLRDTIIFLSFVWSKGGLAVRRTWCIRGGGAPGHQKQLVHFLKSSSHCLHLLSCPEVALLNTQLIPRPVCKTIGLLQTHGTFVALSFCY